MSVNEMSLSVRQEKFAVSSRVFGLLGMIGAPMLLVFFTFGNTDAGAAKTLKDQIMSLTGVFYMGGWLMSAAGMRRLRVTGDGLSGKIVFIVQITLLSFALLFSVMEVFGYSYENGGLIFAIADAGYPLSHLFMIVVGIFVWRARVWKGLTRFAPFMVGFALPAFFVLFPLLGMQIAGYGFGFLTALGLGIIGYNVYRQSQNLS